MASAGDENLKFKSLSPVVFYDELGLRDVLADHMNGKKGRPSKANKAYIGHSIGAVPKESLRYQYENLR